MTDSTNNAERRLDEDDAVALLLSPEENNAVESITSSKVEVTEEVLTEATPDSERANPVVDDNVAEAEASTIKEAKEEAKEEGEEEVETEASTEDEEELETEEEEETEIVYTTSDGEEVTLDELKKGHLRQADYTQKTQALAEERQAFDQDVQGLGQERNVTAEALMMAMNIVEPQMVKGAQTDWATLQAEDAYEYADQWGAYQQAQARWGQLQQAGVQTQQAQAQHDAMAAQAYQQEQGQALQMAIPDMSDPTKAKALQASLREYALASGLTEAEASGIKDHRVVVMLNKARLYDEMASAGKTVVKKKLSKSPKKVLKSGQPVTKTEKDESSRKAKLAKVKREGSVEAGVEWLLSGGT